MLHEGSGWPFICVTTIHTWNHFYTINAISSSWAVVTSTLERILLLDSKLGLAVTEISINVEEYRKL